MKSTKSGVTPPKSQRRIWSKETKARILQEADENRGRTDVEVGQKYGISPVQISQWRAQVRDKTRQRSFRLSEDSNKWLDEYKQKGGLEITDVVEDILQKHFSGESAYQTVMQWFTAAGVDGAPLDAADKATTALNIFRAIQKPLKPSPAKQAHDRLISAAAYDAVLSLWRAPEDFIQNWTKDRQYIQYPYTMDAGGPGNFSQIDAFQRELLREVELLDETVPFDLTYADADRKKAAFYDLTMRADIAFRPRIFCYAFYLSKERRSHFGIIEYGRYKRFGLLLLKTTWEAFLQVKENRMLGETIGKGHQTQDTVKRFFVAFIAFIYGLRQEHDIAKKEDSLGESEKRPPQFYSLDGFIHDELVTEVIYRRCPPTTVDQFRSVLSKIEAPMNEVQKEVRRCVNETGNRQAVFFFDLLCTEWVKEDDEMMVIPIDHHLDIPVGIGFTLTALPKMIERNEHGKLVDSLTKYFADDMRFQALAADFYRTGVELKRDKLTANEYNQKG